MQRRSALKNMATGAGALFALPLWATSWNAETLLATQWLAAQDKVLLEAICEAILPKTTKYPGASDLKVHVFVEKMIADCYDATTQQEVKNNLQWLVKQSESLFNTSFEKATIKQRLNMLQSLEVSSQGAKSNFYKLMKSLSLQGYTNSEYYLTNVMKYELVPGRYNGCKKI